GEALPGVNIILKGSTSGQVTEINGAYSINVPETDAVLVFSFVGYISQEISVNGRQVIDVTLSEDLQMLSVVIVAGYGVSSRKKTVSSATQVDAYELATYSFTITIEMLTGRAKGVITMVQGGVPGTLPTISIRGGGEPLYIIDGVPATKQEFAGLAPTDIESYTILKDAAAAAVYGARAGNGVVRVTTKRGRGGLRRTENSSV